MDRRAFLFSTAWLAVAPAPSLSQAPGDTRVDGPPRLAQQDTVFATWMAAFVQKAEAQGVDADMVRQTLSGVMPDPHVIALDQRQPEFSKPISGYISQTASNDRALQGRNHLEAARHWLDPISLSYQTSPQILVSIWAVESAFGQLQGDDDVIRSMATLAAEGRRQAFAESELIGALRILQSGEASRSQLRGSWAGAMGQTQFTPLDYLAYAVDADGDGKRDIWGSSADALASTANFLVKKAHWRAEQSIQIEVTVPTTGFDYTLLEGPEKTPSEWAKLGVTPADGRILRDVDSDAPTTLLMPMGWRGPGFLAFPNHMAVRAYNNSTAYALAVGLLADRIAGAGPLVQSWPADLPISLTDRVAAQQALKALGFYDGVADGLLGAQTRKAARLWQAQKDLPPDGYLSYALIQRLKADAQPTQPQVAAPSG